MELKLEKIKKYWGTKVINSEKIDESNIKDFEKKYDVIIPTAIKKYLLCLNGMNETLYYQDKDGISFWSLHQINRFCETKENEHYQLHPSFLLYFADYLDWCWAYAIELGCGTENVLMVGYKEFPIKIANSFSEFLDLYLDNRILDADILL